MRIINAFAVLAAMMVLGIGVPGAEARPTVYPTGTTIFNPEKAQPNVFIMTVGEDHISIVDRNGNEYHRWTIPSGYSNVRARLDSKGNLLVGAAQQDMSARDTWALAHPASIAEYTWDGKKLWEYNVPEGLEWHNEVQKLKNGNIIFPAYTVIPEEYRAKIKNVELPWGTFKREGIKMRGDVVMEVNPKTGKTVWEWKTWEHLDLNKFSPMTPTNDWTHMNAIQELPANKWYDAGDKRFQPGNLLVNPRNLDEMYIINKKTGQVVWTGSHSYKFGLAHCHEPMMIAKGLPGEGNILFLDNGLFAKNRDRVGQSLLGELNPVTGELVWQYETQGYSNMHFFTKTMGSEERLPNGNTFISEDNAGRLFEVTYDPKNPEGGEIVWEYMLPTISQRSHIYPADFCPQFKAIKRVREPYAVVPPNNADFHVPGSTQK
jgi:outer membrane protein assembly factor BamB